MKNKFLYGKNVFVTGASSGIGKAIALFYGMNGYHVTGVSRNCKEGTHLFPGGGSLTMRKMDVTKSPSIQRVIRDLPEIDIAVFAAGMGVAGSIEDTPLEYARRQMEVNYFGTLRCIKAVLPVMREKEHGLILVIGSVAGQISIPMQSHYSSSKYALEALVDALRMEAAPYNIRACLIEPGDTKTCFTAMRETYYKPDSPYNDAVRQAVGQMEKDEQNGVSPKSVAKIAYQLSYRKNPPVRVTAGLKYKTAVKLTKLLPERVREALVSSIYLKKTTENAPEKEQSKKKNG